MRLTGAFTALVTPFRNGCIDEERYREFIEWQIQEGIDGLVPCGTTGESATLSHEEHEAVIRICIEQAKGRVPVIAGAGSNNTKEALGLARFAKQAGADALLLITPYYNKPSQEGLFAHFKAVTDEVALPTIAYNVPGRTGVDFSNDSVIALSQHPNIVGVKDATGDLSRISVMRAAIHGQFDYLSGDDPSWLGYAAHGGHGVISVTSNVAPEGMVALHNAITAGDFATARTWQDRLIGLHKGLFLDNSPSPTKYALSRLGLCSEEVRSPLAPTAEAVRPAIDRAMADAGVA